MIVSTDGGDSFHAVASPATGITTLDSSLTHVHRYPVFSPLGNFRVLTVPTACVFGQRVAVAWADFRESVSRIYYALSINGGASWTTGPSGQPLLTGLPANLHHLHHFHPQMISGRKGVIGCAFYEFGPKPTTPLIDVIMAQSFDGGASFNHFTVTDQPWDPAKDAPWSHHQRQDPTPIDKSVTFIGDYFGLDASVRGFYPLWTDTWTGIQELWTAIVGPFVLSEALPPHIIGRVDRNYQGADTGVPLLNSFYFRFEKPDSSEAVDNRINTISVFPAGSAEDLTPNADLKPPTVERGKIMLIYQDQAVDEDKDHYFYKVSHLVEPSPPSPIGTVRNVRRFQIRDVGCSGKCVRALPIRPSNREVFVLVGFHLFFTGGRDHNIDEVAVFEDSGNLTVAFNDRNDDDVFGYSVDYALWSPDDPQSTIETHEERRTAHGGDRIDLPAGEKVIQGFSFNFKTGDHFLREIGVLIGPSAALPSSNLEVYFGDKNGDDTFEWNVRWASMKPGVFK